MGSQVTVQQTLFKGSLKCPLRKVRKSVTCVFPAATYLNALPVLCEKQVFFDFRRGFIDVSETIAFNVFFAVSIFVTRLEREAHFHFRGPPWEP